MATLLLYGVLLRYAIARPISPASFSADASPSVNEMASDAPDLDTNYRSTVEIVWSCLTVIIASSWLCVHPNVTGYRTTMWQRLCERLVLFAIALFAPEVMAVFAYYQYIGCRKLYEEFGKRAKELGITLLPASSSSTPPGTEPHNGTNGQIAEAHDRSDPKGVPGSSTSLPTEESRNLLDATVPTDRGPSSATQPFWGRILSSLKAISCAILSFGKSPKEETWSHTHAHFIQMGGIVFKDPAGSVGFKRPEQWEDDEIRAFFALNLTEADISDKSKAGALAKTLVIARVLWFLIQAVARRIQGLPIALLEVASLAFIAFNISMYIFWWNKPLDVDVPLKIGGNPGGRHTLSGGKKLNLAANMLVGHLDNIPIGTWLYSPKRQRYPRLYSFGKRIELLRQSGSLNPELDRTFALCIAVVSSAFGAFHTIGWFLPAPTQVERTLWRVSCLILTLYPYGVFAIAMLIFFYTRFILEKTHFGLLTRALYWTISLSICVPCGVAYVGARLTIMFLPFFELRSLTPLIHRTVSWSRFLTPT